MQPDVLVIPDQDHDRLVIPGVTADQDPDPFLLVVAAEAVVEAVMVVVVVQDPLEAAAVVIGK